MYLVALCIYLTKYIYLFIYLLTHLISFFHQGQDVEIGEEAEEFFNSSGNIAQIDADIALVPEKNLWTDFCERLFHTDLADLFNGIVSTDVGTNILFFFQFTNYG